MLETILISVGVAAGVALFVSFLGDWTLRVRLRRVESELEDLAEGLLIEKKRRAASASVASRAERAAALDAAIVKEHTGVDLSQSAEEPWWGSLRKSGPS